ncbi:M23 family metallopeptidase [Arthrobacter sp. 260]|uniref:M23 family metallopeptidase n=1 Tax=Arthrobacter sp. 260 TaxID=2735314 RepID=UPI00149265D1|nr:M23 family metallopeptidase [Arthrobacter sp. 260]NOJ59768.1 M23 family metallopeptidase [Arthrobacter sp. 260]
MTVLKRHPVDRPSISQRFAALSNRGSHLGVDYRPDYPGQTDFPVYAAHDGYVVFAKDGPHSYGNPWEQIPGNGNNGRSVILQAVAPHQACATSYNHLGNIAVREGQWVTAGTFLGYMGWSGFVIPADPNGTHLHFELFIDYGNGQYPAGTSYGRVNPLDYFAIETIVPVAPGPGGGSGTTKPTTPAPQKPKEWYEMPIPQTDLDKITRDLLHQQVPLNKGDKAYPAGFSLSVEYLLFDARRLAQQNASQLASQSAQIKGLIGAIAAISKGEPFDEAKLLAGVKSAAEAGVKNAVDSIEKTETTTVTIKEG